MNWQHRRELDRPMLNNQGIDDIPAAHASPAVETDVLWVSPQIFESFLYHQPVTPQTIHGSPPSAIRPGAMQ
jgi:hypothetical protein